METIKTTEGPFEKLHNEWIGSLLAYEEHLNNTQAVTKQLQSSVNDMQFKQQLSQLRTAIEAQKTALGELSKDIQKLRRKFAGRAEKKVIPLDDLIENNRYREKVRKSEQAVFLLKYQTNKLLSIAS